MLLSLSNSCNQAEHLFADSVWSSLPLKKTKLHHLQLRLEGMQSSETEQIQSMDRMQGNLHLVASITINTGQLFWGV